MSFRTIISGSAENKIHLNLNLIKKSIISFFVILVLLYTSLEEYTRIKGYFLWFRAKRIVAIENYVFSEKLYTLAYPYLKHNGDFLCDFGNLLKDRMKPKESLKMLLLARNFNANSYLYFSFGNVYSELSDFENAEKSYRMSINMLPNRFTSRISLMYLYEKYGYSKKALQTANDILIMPVKVNSFYTKMYKSEATNLVLKYKN